MLDFDLGAHIQEMAQKRAEKVLHAEDAAVKDALRSLGMLDVAKHVIESKNQRLGAALARSAGISIEVRDRGSQEEPRAHRDVLIKGKLFRRIIVGQR